MNIHTHKTTQTAPDELSREEIRYKVGRVHIERDKESLRGGDVVDMIIVHCIHISNYQK